MCSEQAVDKDNFLTALWVGLNYRMLNRRVVLNCLREPFRATFFRKALFKPMAEIVYCNETI